MLAEGKLRLAWPIPSSTVTKQDLRWAKSSIIEDWILLRGQQLMCGRGAVRRTFIRKVGSKLRPTIPIDTHMALALRESHLLSHHESVLGTKQARAMTHTHSPRVLS